MFGKNSPRTRASSRLTWEEFANRDFCPWVNPYIYWLKEPVGWFVIATIASLLVGAFLSSLGWGISLGLTTILLIGLGFPWIAVRSVRCALTPNRSELHEMESSFLILEIRNRLPIPLMGLQVQDFFSGDSSRYGIEELSGVKAIALSRIPAWSNAVFRLPIRPENRGRYPAIHPSVTCAFPFGIWTAKKKVDSVKPLVVWPMLLPAQGTFELPGAKRSETGNGERVSTSGEFLGVREFRRGDSLKSIHWVQSARQDSLVVCERGGPQQATVDFQLCTQPTFGTLFERSENLAWRIRIAASLIDILVSHHVPFRFWIDDQRILLPNGSASREIAWEYLSEIPWIASDASSAGNLVKKHESTSGSVHRFVITSEMDSGVVCDSQHLVLRIESTASRLRSSHHDQESTIDLDQDIAIQLNDFLMEMNRDSFACR